MRRALRFFLAPFTIPARHHFWGGLVIVAFTGWVMDAQLAKGLGAPRREFAELKNRSDTLLYTCERSLETFGESLRDVDRRDVPQRLPRLGPVDRSREPDRRHRRPLARRPRVRRRGKNTVSAKSRATGTSTGSAATPSAPR